jgi:hypothetical protein
VYLERGNELPQALATLRRMTLVSGPTFAIKRSPFESFEPAGDLLVEFHHEAEAKEFFAKSVQATPWNARARLKLGRAAEVASDTTAPYSLRAEGALKLAPAKNSLQGELALLASGAISPSSARQPFFVESRLAVAQSASDSALKLSLLREALAIAPNDPRVRLAAVRAALDAHNDRLALALYQAATGPAYALGYPPDENAPPQESFQGNGPPLVPDRGLMVALSAAAERLGDLTSALAYTGFDDRQRSAALKKEISRRAENLSRQPVITDNVQQAQIVRPRELP